MNKLAFAVVAFGAAYATASEATQQRLFLDVSDPAVHLTREGQPVRGSCLGAGSSGGVAPPRLPLRVTFRPFKEWDHRLGEPALFEVTLENVGETSITVPWLPSQSLADVPAARVLMARVGLVGADDQGGKFEFGGAYLEGTPDVAGSTITLHPRESATVRAAGRMRDIREGLGDIRTPLNRELKLTAEFQLTTEPCRWTAPIVSDAAVTVTIRPR